VNKLRSISPNLKLRLSLGKDDARFEVLLQGKAKQKLDNASKR
jgi:hypothetical protein